MPFLCLSVVLHMTQSIAMRNRKPDVAHPYMTPVVNFNHLILSPLPTTVLSKSLYTTCTILVSLSGMPYNLISFLQSFAVASSK